MNEPTLSCRTERRRDAVRQAEWNGLDYLEVSDDQLELTLYFLAKAPENLSEAHVRIRGGERVRNLRVLDLQFCRQRDPEIDDCVIVTVDRPGDFSTYEICLVDLDEDGRPTDRPFPGLDPRYACLEFSFKAGCPSELDCRVQEICPPEERQEPEIDYLAKDYRGFRRLILDRLALLMPDWCERHVPDVGITLVELLAYAGDHLSYYQDAVATEAYLDTARQRVSVRRHARLVDYALHEGCNARAWLCIETDTDLTLATDDVFFVAASDVPAEQRILSLVQLQELPESSREIFEPLMRSGRTSIRLRVAHNRIRFYTWGDEECCLPRGTTSATLRDEWVGTQPQTQMGVEEHPDQETYLEHDTPPRGKPETDDDDAACEPTETDAERRRALGLEVGDVLILEEVIGPKTGNPSDADPKRRHPVCLTRVEPGIDPLFDQPVVEVEWAEEDALPFALCLSTIGPAAECRLLVDVSVACGNVLLVDHGERCREPLGQVPLERSDEVCGDDCHPAEMVEVPGLFRPRLVETPVSFSEPPPPGCPARGLLLQDPRAALPQIIAIETANGERHRWLARRDLLASERDDRHFVAEIENDGRARLRFGDGELGRAPAAGAEFEAVYRVGNGPAGNVGAGAISRLVYRPGTLSGVALAPRNPLPAQGGTAAESLAEGKLFAPHRFRKELARAITGDDYAAIVQRDFRPRVQRAAASLRWTGSRYEVLVAVDQRGRLEAEPELLAEIERHLENYRRVGHDLVVAAARQVPIDLDLIVCVEPGFLRGHVQAAVLEVLSNRVLPNGEKGFFHPDTLTFGEGIFVSRLVATVRTVKGVENVVVRRLERLHEGPNREVELGRLALGRLEIARLDNDPNFPERGRLHLEMRGGR